MASALVLRRNVQNVWERSYAGEGPDALSRPFIWGGIVMKGALGRKRLVSLRYIQLGRIRRRSAHRLSVLNGHQFCRGQKSRPER